MSSPQINTTTHINILFVLDQNVIKTGVQKLEGGWRCRILVFKMAGYFFDCSKVFAVAKKSDNKKGNNK